MNRRKLRKKRKKIKINLKKLFVFFILLYIVSFIIAGINIDKLKENIIKDASGLLFERAVNESVGKAEDEFFGSLYGDENSFSVDSALISDLKVKLTNEVNRSINSSETIFIPAGNFTGVWFLEGVGLPIPIRLSFSGVCRLNFHESFESAGVNQTLYTLKITAEAIMHTNSLKYGSEEILQSTEYILIQRLIIGEVPGVFAKGS